MPTTFLGTNDADTIVPGAISSGVEPLGPDATPGDGDDVIIARGGNDVVAGGKGADTAVLGAGDDTFGWAPADGSDAVFGGAGRDRLVFDGDGSTEAFALAQGSSGLVLDRDVGAVTMQLAGMEVIDILAGAGQDTVSVENLTGSGLEELAIDLAAERGATAGDGEHDRVRFTLGGAGDVVDLFGSAGNVFVSGLPAFVTVANADTSDVLSIAGGGGGDSIRGSGLSGAPSLVLSGGGGDDTLAGADGDDRLLGGGGDDLVSGGRGDDVAKLGAGFDGFFWVEGDGSDTVDGGAGTDFLSFAGINAAESFALTAAAGGARLTRDVGGITMDLTAVESVSIFAAGGGDVIAIGDLTGTGVTAVDVSLSTPGQPGDGAADTISILGGSVRDAIEIASGAGTLVTVSGLAAGVDLFGVEATDSLTVSGGDGGDEISAIDLDGVQPRLVIDGGAGDDFLFGSSAADTLLGGEGDDIVAAGAGDDVVRGGRGNEIVILNEGDDRFVWSDGDGNDAVVGVEGTDTLAVDGSGVSETFDIAANGLAAVLTRDVDDVRIDLEAMERIELGVGAGTDEIRVGDLTGTTLEEIVIDLGAPDGAADLIVVHGTELDDDVTLRIEGDAIVVEGLAATLRILGAEAGLDQILVRGFGGEDRIDAGALSGIGLLVQAGEGDDIVLGSSGADTLSGDGGDDVILAGDGNDNVFGNDGDDALDGGPGLDTLNPGAGDDVLLNGEIVGGADAAALFGF